VAAARGPLQKVGAAAYVDFKTRQIFSLGG
jgi:hypothetical protein